jgi:hypothetical protein
MQVGNGGDDAAIGLFRPGMMAVAAAQARLDMASGMRR